MTGRVASEAASTVHACRVYMFPCGFDKKPKVKWREQSTNNLTIIRQWEKVDGFIPAIDCDKSNLLVVDVDCHDGSVDGFALWDQLVAKHGLPFNAPIARTPSGGLHIYFSQPDRERFGNHEGEFAGKGINIRGDGGYVIAPGATLPDGRSWSRIKGSGDIFATLPPLLPEWIAAKIRPQQSTPSVPMARVNITSVYGAAVLQDICTEIANTPPGGQSIALVKGSARIG